MEEVTINVGQMLWFDLSILHISKHTTINFRAMKDVCSITAWHKIYNGIKVFFMKYPTKLVEKGS